MKVLRDIRFWLAIGAICLALFLWLATGLITTGEPPTPLSVVLRLVLMTAFLIAIASLSFALYLSSRRTNSNVLSEISEGHQDTATGGDPGLLDEEEQQLRAKFAKAAEILKTKRFGAVGKRRHLYQLPWYIVIGSPGSGKTTAIRHSGLEFPLDDLTQGGSLSGVGGTRNCDWWVTDQAVLLDTAGRYTTQDSDAKYDAKGWQNFLELLRRNRKKQPINGAVIVVSTDEIIKLDDNEWKQHARTLTVRLRELIEQLQMDFPVYLLVTKLDLLPGCREFFDNLDVDEQEQIWGVTQSVDSGIEGLDKALNQLATRLHEQVATKLRFERDMKRRQAIYSFPWQIENINRRLAGLTEEVFSRQGVKEHANFRGLYFTSAIQEGSPIERLFSAVVSGFGVTGSIAGRPERSRSLFLRRLFPRVIFQEAFMAGTNTAHDNRIQHLRLAAFIGIVALGIGLAMVWTGAFTVHRSLLTEAQAHLSDYTKSSHGPDQSLEKNLMALDQLAQAAAVFDQQKHPWLSNLGMYDGSIDESAKSAYYRGIETLLLPEIGEKTSNWLAAFTSRDYQENLDALKAYLMLTDSERRDSEWFLEWLEYPPIPSLRVGEPGSSISHMNAFFAARPEYELTPVNETTVDRTRSFLQRATDGAALYSRLKSDWRFEKTDIIDRLGPYFTSTFTSPDLDRVLVPTLYTVAGYMSVDFSIKSRTVRGWLDDRWVVGYEKMPNPMEIAAAVEEARRLYTRDYLATWRQVLNNMDINVPRGKDALSDTLGVLSDPTLSPMSALLSVVSDETQLPSDSEAAEEAKRIVADTIRSRTGRLGRAASDIARAGDGARKYDIPTEVASAFRLYHAMLEGGTISKSAKVASQLGELREWVNGIRTETSANPAQSLLQTADDLATPFDRWVASLARSASQSVRSGEWATVNRLWSKEVAEPCSRAFDDRFPFDHNAQAEASLADFEDFFRPGGIEESFVQRYLEDKFKLPRTAEFALRQAQRVRDAFFANRRDLGFNYELTGVNVDDRIGQVTIETGDGQRVRFRHGPPVPLELRWPDGDAGLRITFLLKNGSTRRLRIDGPWAMFKAVYTGGGQAVSGASSQMVTFTEGDYRATFRITSSSRVNPFQPGLLDKYRCRSSL